MSVTSLGASTNAYSYLQSLLPQQPGDGSAVAADPVTELIDAFYPGGNGQANADPTSDPSASPPPSGITFAPFSPDMMSALMSVQEQQSAPPASAATQAQSVFKEFDQNGDGSISKSEFENAFGSNADTSKVDGLFNALDANGDGSISQSELTSAAQASKGAHAHHHHKSGSGQSGGGMLDQLMAATQGATSQTDNGADGSTTTTITYADGSKVTMTTPAAASGSQSDQNGAANDNNSNLLEQLISRQAQMLAASASQSLASV